MVAKYIPDLGDIIWLNFSPQQGSEQAGRTPALVISRQVFNKTRFALACPITSKIKGYPLEVVLSKTKTVGCVLTNHIKSVDWKAREARFIEKADKALLNQVQKLVFSFMLP